MPGTTIGINMNYGYPGQASRHGDEVSRTRVQWLLTRQTSNLAPPLPWGTTVRSMLGRQRTK